LAILKFRNKSSKTRYGNCGTNNQLWFSCSIIWRKTSCHAQQGKPIYGPKIDFITLKIVAMLSKKADLMLGTGNDHFNDRGHRYE
jgi:hypothetical protein